MTTINPSVSGHDLSVFREFLDSYRDRRVYFFPHAGNLGDKLIELGAELALRQANVNRVENPEDAELIFLNGGGSFNTFWAGALYTAIGHRRRCPDIPLVVGPQTYSFNSAMLERLNELIDIGPAPITLFAREQESFRLLQHHLADRADKVALALSPDLAFELQESDWAVERRGRRRDAHILVSFRGDVESPFPLVRRAAQWQRRLEWNKWHRSLILASKAFRRGVQIPRSAVASRIVSQYVSQNPQLSGLPTLRVDATAQGTMDQFFDRIEQSALVVTDRLHVSICAYLIGVPVAIVVDDHFHKVEGVYRLSMSGTGSSASLFDRRGRRKI